MKYILMLLTIGLLSACTTTIDPDTDQETSPFSSAPPLSSSAGTLPVTDDPFRDGPDGFSGSFYARGYGEVVTVPEPFCETDCEEFDYVFFHILDASESELDSFLSINEGNAYVMERAVGLGCATDDGIIRYSNQTGTAMVEHRLGSAVSEAILSSSADNPIVLKLTKEPIDGGTDAPACYSHFTTIEQADSVEVSE